MLRLPESTVEPEQRLLHVRRKASSYYAELLSVTDLDVVLGTHSAGHRDNSLAACGESRFYGDRQDRSSVLDWGSMAMGTTRDDGSQQAMWVATADLPPRRRASLLRAAERDPVRGGLRCLC